MINMKHIIDAAAAASGYEVDHLEPPAPGIRPLRLKFHCKIDGNYQPPKNGKPQRWSGARKRNKK